VIEGMKGALLAFDKKVPGFASAAGVLIAPETRTTSPMRFSRGRNCESPTLPGLIPSVSTRQPASPPEVASA
jgi:uncharacterized FAD-dependent dehydrogenase